MSVDKKQNNMIKLTICKSVTRHKCIYIGQFRVYGGKPLPVENNVLETYDIDISQIERALEFHKKKGNYDTNETNQ